MGLRITGVLNLFAVALICGFLVSTGVAVFSLLELRVGGPVSVRQTQASDLVADVLPPPLYMVEAFLTAYMGADQPSRAAETTAHLAKLRGEYEDRREHWRATPIPAEIKAKVLDESDPEVRKFWDVIDNQYLPALRTGDKAAVQATIPALEAPYRAHRAVIDQISAMAAKEADNQLNLARSSTMTVFSLLAVTCLVRDRSYRAALTELDQLGVALRTRPVVDQACGIVMHVLGCDADMAFGVLRRISQSTQRKLSDVASAVVDKRGRGLERELASLSN